MYGGVLSILNSLEHVAYKSNEVRIMHAREKPTTFLFYLKLVCHDVMKSPIFAEEPN